MLVAQDGPEALALFALHLGKIAAVVTDLAMPIMGGLMLVRALRRMEPSLKVIISTGWADELQTADIAALGVDDCLTKPFTTRDLLLKLNHVLHGDIQDAAWAGGRRIRSRLASINRRKFSLSAKAATKIYFHVRLAPATLNTV